MSSSTDVIEDCGEWKTPSNELKTELSMELIDQFLCMAAR